MQTTQRSTGTKAAKPQAPTKQSQGLQDVLGNQALQQAMKEGASYTVQPGDTLWGIAETQLGRGAEWGDVFRENESVIGADPNQIQPGMVLEMPVAGEVEEGVADMVETVTVCTSTMPETTRGEDLMNKGKDFGKKTVLKTVLTQGAKWAFRLGKRAALVPGLIVDLLWPKTAYAPGVECVETPANTGS